MFRWFDSVAKAAAAESRFIGKTPAAWIAAFAMPLFWCLLLVLAFGTGIMERLPVGLVDLDHSSLSRSLYERIDAIPSMRLERFETSGAADKKLRAGETFATVTIPPNYEKDQLSGSGAAIKFDLNKTYYAVGTILELDFKTALADMQSAQGAASMTRMGGTFEANASRLRITVPDVYFLGNTAFNFCAYLLPTLIPGVMALGAVMAFVSSLVREWREGSVRRMLLTAGNSPTAMVVGKLVPWLLLYALAACAWVSGFVGFGGWTPGTPLETLPLYIALWITASILLILSMAGLALLCTSLSLTWALAVTTVICLIAPTFPFTGFSYPLEAMSEGAAFFGSLLPLTHFLRVQSAVWILGSPLDHVMTEMLMLALYPIVFFAAGLPIIRTRIFGWAKKEEEQASTRETTVASKRTDTPGFFSTIVLTLKGSFLNRDTFVVFAAGVAFYLVFYGWPYNNQQIENLPVGIVDLDQSPASRRIIHALDASSTANVMFVETSADKGLDAFRREKTDILVTIPEDFERKIATGENTTLHVLGNGAFPVKTRAVQAAVAGIATDAETMLDEASVRTAGLPVSALGSSALKAPGLIVEYRFNSISGYGNYTVPMVGPLIIQAVLLMGITMALGGWLGRRVRPTFVEAAVRYPLERGFALFCAFWFIAFLWFLYMEGFDFAVFQYGAMENPAGTIWVGIAFSAAVAAFAMAIAALFASNAWTSPAVVVMSAPALFISGAVWPLPSITNPLVLAAAQFIPSTPGIRAIAAVAQGGASTASIAPAILHLFALTIFYLAITALAAHRIALNEKLDTASAAPNSSRIQISQCQ